MISSKFRISPAELLEYDLNKDTNEEVVVTYQMAASYLRTAFIYLTETLEILADRIDEATYLKLAFLVNKIINSMQRDAMSNSIFW